MRQGTYLLSRRGKDFSTYRCGAPGFRCELRAGTFRFGISTAWKARLGPAFASGPIADVTGQLGFVTCCDGRQSDSWQRPGFDDSGWETAIAADDCGIPEPRPMARCAPGGWRSVVFANLGFLLRSAEGETFAATVTRDLMRPVPAARFFGLRGLYGLEPVTFAEPHPIQPPRHRKPALS